MEIGKLVAEQKNFKKDFSDIQPWDEEQSQIFSTTRVKLIIIIKYYIALISKQIL